MRFGERVERGHVSAIGLDRLEHVLGQGDRIEFEVGFEEEVDDVVDSPFSRLFEWCSAHTSASLSDRGEERLPVTKTSRKDPVQMSRGIFQLLVLLGLGIEVVKIGHRAGRGCSALVCLDGEDPEVLACHVQTGYRPGFEAIVGVSSDEGQSQIAPCFVDFNV